LSVCGFDLAAKCRGVDLGQPDQRLDRFALAEEQLPLALRITPVQQQPLRFRRHVPLARGQFAPLIDVLADFVDQDVGRDLVFERQLALLRAAPSRAAGTGTI
jgi:hypothetical protein